MTAVTLDRLPLQTVLQQAIAWTIAGTYEPDACICGVDDCIHVQEARHALDIALRAVGRAPTDAARLAIWFECAARLTGIPEDEWSVSITPAEAGGAR